MADSEQRETDVPVETREGVAHAVRRALAKHGYAALTTKKVAAETDKSEATLFYHYETKDDLIAVFLRFSIGWLSRRIETLETDDPVERLITACELLLVDPDDEYMRRINIAVMELLSHAPYNETLREPLLEYERHVHNTLADILQDGIEQGQFCAVDPDATAAFILATTDGSTGCVLALEMDDMGKTIRTRLFEYIESELLVRDQLSS